MNGKLHSQAVLERPARSQPDGPGNPIGNRHRFVNIVGRSRRLLEMFDVIERVAASDANILIQGESGTGKELIADAIHERSRPARPFIKINCAAMPSELVESELFGYKKGSFTGATVDRQGLLELAANGSLLLDEIGEMPAYLQTKLLRVLQEREYRPLGSQRIVRVNFRLLTATNTDIERALREASLREDLYYRINTVIIQVPPLRVRREDIPLLCKHFLEKFQRQYQKAVGTISPAAAALLMDHWWPGNVRELENALERAVVMCKGSGIAAGDLPESLRRLTGGPVDFVIPARRTLAEIEKTAIVQTLRRTNWNKTEAADALGLYRPTLYGKIKKYGIVDEGVRVLAGGHFPRR
jgi:transcriptional regulator with PAS, ATPase and Fis domain